MSFGKIKQGNGERILLYGTGGIGKTTLAVTAPGPVAIFDLDESLSQLQASFAESGLSLDVRPVDTDRTWNGLRNALQSSGWDEIKTIVLDSMTCVERACVAYAIANIPHEKGLPVRRIEDWGWGKGYVHVHGEFLNLLADLEIHMRAGRHVILIAQECTVKVPNPGGEDYLQYQPRLQLTDRAPIRLEVKEQADHVLYYGYDIDVKDGKGKGSGTRTIWPVELPHCMAKSRKLSTPIPVTRFDTTLWKQLGM